MSASPIPLIVHACLQPLDAHPAVHLLDVRYDASQYDASLFSRLQIPPPAHLTHAVKKRRVEYLVSRYSVQQAMRTFGIAHFILGNGEIGHRCGLQGFVVRYPTRSTGYVRC